MPDPLVAAAEALERLGRVSSNVLAHIDEQCRNPDYRWFPEDYAAELREARDGALTAYAALRAALAAHRQRDERAEAAWLPTHQHIKGGYYRLLSVAVHTETKEAFVIYDDRVGRIWARPREMFEDGRFALLSDAARRRWAEVEGRRA